MTDGNPARVLVAEDEFLIAMEIAEILQDDGYEVIGPAASLDAARKLVRDGARPDLAVIDANLASQSSAPLASELRRMGVAFCVCTGYRSDDLMAAFGPVPILQKPVDASALLNMLRGLAAK